jgi:hypothetical protein
MVVKYWTPTVFDGRHGAWGEEFSFVAGDLDDVVAAKAELFTRMRMRDPRVRTRAGIEPLEGGFEGNAGRLDGVDYLFVQTAAPGWVAVWPGGHQWIPGFRFITVIAASDVRGSATRNEKYGSLQIAEYNSADRSSQWSVDVSRDGGTRWSFERFGPVQPFEDVLAYERHLVRERFTGQMLVDYCSALGLRPFDDDFYPGPSRLVHIERYLTD